MSFFPFDLKNAEGDRCYAGTVQNVDTRKVVLEVGDLSLERISVGKLVTLPVGILDEWLIGFVERIVCKIQYANVMTEGSQQKGDDAASDGGPSSGFTQGNAVMVTLVGTVRRTADDRDQIVHAFTRSLMNVPDVKAPCFVLRERALETFMSLLVKTGDTEHALALGHYALDPSATAYLDGDKFFQRHAALWIARCRSHSKRFLGNLIS